MSIEKINLNCCLKIEVVGLIISEAYQRAKFLLNTLCKYYPKQFCIERILGLLEVKWKEYLHNLQIEKGGSTWSLQRPVMVAVNGKFLGSDDELVILIKKKYTLITPPLSFLHKLAYEDYTEFLNKNPRRTYVFLELNIGPKYIGGLLFELYSDLLPKTCERFTNFCDKNNESGLSYYGSTIHRICKSGWFQGGEIYGVVEEKFPDENYSISHDKRGILSMANDGKHSNGSQFFITFQPSQWMDRYYVAFGQVVEGTNALTEIERSPCTYESPNEEIFITNCGVLPVGKELRKEKQKIFIKKQKLLPKNEMPYPLYTKDYISRLLIEELDKKLPDDPTDFFVAMLFKAIWEKLPPLDELDSRDASSMHYLEKRYREGLYCLEYRLTTELLKKYKTQAPKGYHQEIVDFVIHFVQKRMLHDTISETSGISTMFFDKYELEDVYKTAIALVDEVRKAAEQEVIENAHKIAVKIVSEIIEVAKLALSKKMKEDEMSNRISYEITTEKTEEVEDRISKSETVSEVSKENGGEMDIIISERTKEETGEKDLTVTKEDVNEKTDFTEKREDEVIENDTADGIQNIEDDESTENIANDIINGLIEIALQTLLEQ